MESGIFSTIGHTPLVRLKKIYPGRPFCLYAKLEMFNPGGSIKDRPAFFILSQALKKGLVKENTTIIESSSGNMAIGLAQICRYLGLHLIVVVDPKINNHTLKILQAYGGTVDKVSEPDSDGNFLAARLQRVKELTDQLPDSYWPNQYANKSNTEAHYHTMEEIVAALPEPPDYLLAATSTCGTVMGCADYVQQHKLNTKIIAVDAVGSVIFGMPSADRLVPGHGASHPAELLEKGAVDHVLHITDEESIIGCRRLLHTEAILAGGSSGAVVMAAEKLQSEIPEGSTGVLILPDSGERYLDTIFNDRWVKKNVGNIEALNKFSVGKNESRLNNTFSLVQPKSDGKNGSLKTGSENKSHKIAIIGGGPKGMYGFERLAAQFKAHPPVDNIEIHIYNKDSQFGVGNPYHTGQPSYLRTNNPIGDINMWIDEDPESVISEPLSLAQWLRCVKGEKISPNDYTSRAAVGQYLQHGFEQISAKLPAGLTGKYRVGEVIDICKKGTKYSLELKTATGSGQVVPDRYDHVLLATGHPQNKPGRQEMKYFKFAEKKAGIGFIPFIYPVESSLNTLPAGCKVGVRGIGLTFIDAVLALTEGRGGSFYRASSGKLTYKSSGREPAVIYPFSRSGLPMIPRGTMPRDERPLKFFSEKAVQLSNDDNSQIDFSQTILPLLKQEMTYAFYRVAIAQNNAGIDLASCDTFAEVQHHIDIFHEQNPEIERFDPDQFLHPLTNQHFDDGKVFHEYVQSYLEFFVQQARMGEHENAWAAVTAVWRKATPVFGAFYAYDRLTAPSQQLFDRTFRGPLNRVTFGPPAESTEKIVVLMKAGLINFEAARDANIQIDEKQGFFVLEADHFNIRRPVHYVVDARIDKVSLPDDQSPLYQNMLKKGLIRVHTNHTGQHSYQPGCIDISPEGFVIDDEGVINTAIAVTGTPTEGITYDNDALSRRRNNFVSYWAAFVYNLYQKFIENAYAGG